MAYSLPSLVQPTLHKDTFHHQNSLTLQPHPNSRSSETQICIGKITKVDLTISLHIYRMVPRGNPNLETPLCHLECFRFKTRISKNFCPHTQLKLSKLKFWIYILHLKSSINSSQIQSSVAFSLLHLCHLARSSSYSLVSPLILTQQKSHSP